MTLPDRPALVDDQFAGGRAAPARRVAVLFARADSIYKSFPECDVWDEARDARRWPGGCPVIAHPPCRAWGGLRHMAKPQPGERELTVYALSMVRRWGGVLEHPRRSTLWAEFDLPLGNEVDEFGGFSLLVNQSWWGHKCEKPSLLYVCRVRPSDVPEVTVQLAAPRYVIGSTGRRRSDGQRLAYWRPDVSRRIREATPEPFARWLIELASGAVAPAIGEHGQARPARTAAELSTADSASTAAA